MKKSASDNGNERVWPGNRDKYLSKNPVIKYIVKKFYRRVAELSSLSKPLTILDVGCGEGFITAAIADRLPNTRIIAVELEKENVNYAKERNKRKNITYRQGDLFNLAFEKARFDLVICTEVLEHLKEYEKALNILTGLSKKSVLISVPNEPWFRISNVLRLKYIRHFGNTPGHENQWSRSQIRHIISARGNVISMKTSTLWNIILFEKRVSKPATHHPSKRKTRQSPRRQSF